MLLLCLETSKLQTLSQCVLRWSLMKSESHWWDKRKRKADVEGEIQSKISTIWTWALDIDIDSIVWDENVVHACFFGDYLSNALFRNSLSALFNYLLLIAVRCYVFVTHCPLSNLEKKEITREEEEEEKNLIGNWHHKNKNDIPVCVRALCLTSMKWWLLFFYYCHWDCKR